MAKGYIISSVTVTDSAKYADYVKASSAAITKFGGKPLARGGTHEVLEGEGRARNVILEFDSLEIAKAYYHSPEYQSAKTLRRNAGILSMVVVEGA